MFSMDAAGNGKLNLSGRCTDWRSCKPSIVCMWHASKCPLSGWMTARAREENGISLIRRSWKVSWVQMLPQIRVQVSKRSVCVCMCVCVCVFSGIQRCRCCHAASSGYVISHTGSRQAPLICIEELTNELWHWSSFSWETSRDWWSERESKRDREMCSFLIQRTSVVSLVTRVAG